MMPPPQMMTERGLAMSADTPAKRVGPVQQQDALAAHMRSARDRRNDFVTVATVAAAKHAADDALLHPLRTLGQFARRRETRELGARAGATGRTIVGLARAEDE